jgi:hypothetical protein
MNTDLAVIDAETELARSEAPAQLIGMPVMNVAQMVERHKQLQQIVKDLMEEGQDFGQIPGTQGKMLFKPGAEKLAIFFGLSPNLQLQEKIERWEGDPFFYYRYRCDVSAGHGRGGRVVASCEGSANSNETKWAYVWVEADKKPSEDEIQRLKALGVGRFRKNEKGQMRWCERVKNPRLFDQVNTIQKIAEKRAIVGAIIFATNATGFFTAAPEGDDDETPKVKGKGDSGNLKGAGQEPKDGPSMFWTAVNRAGIRREDAIPISKLAIEGKITWEEAVKKLPIDANMEHEFLTKAKAAGMSNAEIQPILDDVRGEKIGWIDAMDLIAA